jgi:hypothetical protein
MPKIDTSRHNVYVVRLDSAVLKVKKFRDANPDYIDGKPCVYVGMTGLTPEERFENHKRGYKANRFVRKYGVYLMRQKFDRLNPMSWEKARHMEEKLAEKLRRKGFAVWQG